MSTEIEQRKAAAQFAEFWKDKCEPKKQPVFET